MLRLQLQFLRVFSSRAMSSGRVIVYGGKGALGAAVVDYFKSKNFWTLSVDLHKNDEADANVLVESGASWMEQEAAVMKSVSDVIEGSYVDAILCVAGGWAGGNASSAEMVKNADLMWKQSVWSSTICARLAATHLKPGGLVQFTGAAPAVGGTPGMIGYGMAKAAVQQLTKSLACDGSGLPDGASSVAILPVTLDTPMNRKWMAKADFSSWTTLNYVAELLHKWTVDSTSRPTNGSLVKLVTSGGNTSMSML